MLFALLLILPGVAQTQDTSAARVYATVLDSFFVQQSVQRLLVRAQTVTGVGHIDDLDYRNALKGLLPLPEGLQDNFEAHRKDGSFVPAIPTRVPTVFITDSLLRALSSLGADTAREEFQRRFPAATGFFGLSPVGFSTDRKSAMVMVDHPEGTNYYLLTFQAGGWVVIRQIQVRVV